MKQPPVIPPCKNDPRHPTEWICTGCGSGWCDECLSRVGPQKVFEICPECHARCERLDRILSPSGPSGERKKKKVRGAGGLSGWGGILTRAVLQPLKPPSCFLILIAGTLFGVLRVVVGFSGIFSLLGAMVLYGYLSQFWLDLIRAEATGDEGMLDPALDWEGLLHGFFMLFVVLPLFLLGPGWICLYVLEAEVPGVILLGVGVLFLPMGILAAAMYDSGWAINPLYLIRSVLAVFFPNLLLCTLLVICFAAFVAIRSAALSVLEAAPGFPVFAALLAGQGILEIYLLWVLGRVLGGFYRMYEHSLGWSG